MFKYTAGIIPHNIFLVGCGGTGSRLVPLLAQFIKSITHGQSPSGWLMNPNITLVDFDVVEQKNLARQNFIPPDIGKNKAVVLANRYSRAFGMNIFAYQNKLESLSYVQVQGSLGHWFNTQNPTNDPLRRPSLVIMCVDSAKARRQVLHHLFVSAAIDPNYTIYIDAGNEDVFGQVNFFTGLPAWSTESVESIEKTFGEVVPYKDVDVNYIPMPFRYYENLVDGESTRSCADLDQTLAVNAVMATYIISIVQNIYYRRPMVYNGISFSMDGGMTTEYNTLKSFMKKITHIDGRKATRDWRADGTVYSFAQNCLGSNLSGCDGSDYVTFPFDYAEYQRKHKPKIQLQRLGKDGKVEGGGEPLKVEVPSDAALLDAELSKIATKAAELSPALDPVQRVRRVRATPTPLNPVNVVDAQVAAPTPVTNNSAAVTPSVASLPMTVVVNTASIPAIFTTP